MLHQGKVVPVNYGLSSWSIRGMKIVLLGDKAECFSWFPGLYSALGRLKKCVIEREMTRTSDYPPWIFRLGSEMKSEVWSQQLRSNTFRGDWHGCKWLPRLCHDVWSKACYLVTGFVMHCKHAHTVFKEYDRLRGYTSWSQDSARSFEFSRLERTLHQNLFLGTYS